MFITPPLAIVSGPATVPLTQLNVPVTVLVLISVAPLSVRLVIPPLFWNAGPRIRLPAGQHQIGRPVLRERQRRPGEFTNPQNR